MVHGDDFTALGTDSMLNKYETALAKCFDIKLRGRVGEDDSDLKEIRMLNRILRVCAEGLRYEADPRHAEMLAPIPPFRIRGRSRRRELNGLRILSTGLSSMNTRALTITMTIPTHMTSTT